MATGSRVNVKGLTETYKAFNAISDELGDEMKQGLLQAAEPVKALAQQLALTRIRNVPRSPEWAEMRTAVSRRAGVYMVPQKRASRRGKRKRPRFGDLLSGQAMDPALEQNEERVTREVENLLDRLSRKEGF